MPHTFLQLLTQPHSSAHTHQHQHQHQHQHEHESSHGYIPHVLAVLSSIIWPVSWLYTNEHDINPAESTMVRGITTLVFNYIMCVYTGSSTSFQSKHKFPALMTRTIIMTITSIIIAASQYILPLTIVHTIVSSSTLYVFLIDYLLYHTHVNIKQCVGIIIGIIGMLMASSGKFIQIWVQGDNYKQDSLYPYYKTRDLSDIALFTILLIMVMILWSYAYVITKRLQYNVFQINYFLGYSYLLSGCILYQFYEQPHQIQPHRSQVYKSVLFTGIPLIFDQLFLISALKLSKGIGPISMISFNCIIIAYIISIFRYKQRPNMFVNVGVIVLAIGMYQTHFNIHNQNQNQQQMEIQSASGQDNQDGTFKKGIHRSMKASRPQSLVQWQQKTDTVQQADLVSSMQSKSLPNEPKLKHLQSSQSGPNKLQKISSNMIGTSIQLMNNIPPQNNTKEKKQKVDDKGMLRDLVVSHEMFSDDQ